MCSSSSLREIASSSPSGLKLTALTSPSRDWSCGEPEPGRPEKKVSNGIVCKGCWPSFRRISYSLRRCAPSPGAVHRASREPVGRKYGQPVSEFEIGLGWQNHLGPKTWRLHFL